MLFKKYLKMSRFPKKERTKSLNISLRCLSSILDLNHCIMFKISLNMLFIKYQIRFRYIDQGARPLWKPDYSRPIQDAYSKLLRMFVFNES